MTQRAVAWTSRSISLSLLAAAQVIFAAAFSPGGIRAGQWTFPGLLAVDLVPLASGAILAHPFMLYPLWAAFGSGRLSRRYATALLLSLAILSGAMIRGRMRGHNEPLVPAIVITFVFFSLLTVVMLPLRRFGKWQLVAPTCDSSLADVKARRAPVQFRLRHLFECMTLTAAILALCRFYFPDGISADVSVDWRQEFAKFLRAIPSLAALLPAALMPISILSLRKNGRKWSLCAIATLMLWITVDCWLTWREGALWLSAWPEIALYQLGAVASGMTSGIVLRAYGYRLARVAFEPKPAA